MPIVTRRVPHVTVPRTRTASPVDPVAMPGKTNALTIAQMATMPTKSVWSAWPVTRAARHASAMASAANACQTGCSTRRTSALWRAVKAALIVCCRCCIAVCLTSLIDLLFVQPNTSVRRKASAWHAMILVRPAMDHCLPIVCHVHRIVYWSRAAAWPAVRMVTLWRQAFVRPVCIPAHNVCRARIVATAPRVLSSRMANVGQHAPMGRRNINCKMYLQYI